MNELQLALEVAEKAHRGQLRTRGFDTGLPYFDTHIRRVVQAVSTRAKPLAALHDVCEIDGWTVDELRDTYGFGIDLLNGVDMLLRPSSDSYDRHIERMTNCNTNAPKAIIWLHRDVLEVKLCDIIDNLSGLPEGDSLRRRYIPALGSVATKLAELDLFLRTNA